jgi:isovaleryl-CoA dehydrogenase
VEVALEGMQCLGGNGYINGIVYISHERPYTSTYSSLDYPMGRILRDSRLYTVGAGTQEIRRMLIGREFNEQLR